MFLIIHNPLSSNRKSRKKTKKIVRLFKKRNTPFIVRSGLKIDDLNDYLNQRPQITDILLLGGDGSINYFINSTDINLIKQNIYLAKSGSGNDFLRSLKLLKKADVTIGQAMLNNDHPVQFINGCGLGFDGMVCHYVNNDSKKNKISYFINVFRSIIKYQAQDITVKIDGETFEYKKVYTVAIQNGKYFGGGMKATPKANIEDEYYYVLIVHTLSKALLQFLLMTIYSGLHQKFTKYITIKKGKHISVDFKKPNFFQADGEVKESISNIEVKAINTKTFHAFSKKDL